MSININVYLHGLEDEREIKTQLTKILNVVNTILIKEDKIMATLKDVQAAVQAENTVIDSAITLLNGLAQQVKDLAPDQAAIDALAAEISAKTLVLASAVTANTATPPADPTVPVEQPV